MVSTYLLRFKEHNKPSTNILDEPANHPNMNSNGVLESGWYKAPLSYMIYIAYYCPPFVKVGPYYSKALNQQKQFNKCWGKHLSSVLNSLFRIFQNNSHEILGEWDKCPVLITGFTGANGPWSVILMPC